MVYELRAGQFSGPIEKLLELIEDKKLQVTEISLAEVTDDFLKYVKKIAESQRGDRPTSEGLRLLADFIAVASRLIFLKSKSLLPNESLEGDEEAEIRDLELRLKLYKELKPAIILLARSWRGARGQYGRPYFLSKGFGAIAGTEDQSAGVFYPGRDVTISCLADALRGLLSDFKGLTIETETIREKVVTLEEKMDEIIQKLNQAAEASLGNLAFAKTRSEIVVIFLAILHLAREQLVSLEQKDNFSDIIVKGSGRDR